MNRPLCDFPRCDVQVRAEGEQCDGHMYLSSVEKRKTNQFAAKSRRLLERAIENEKALLARTA